MPVLTASRSLSAYDRRCTAQDTLVHDFRFAVCLPSPYLSPLFLFGLSSICPFSLSFFHYSVFPLSLFLFSCFLHYIYLQSVFLSVSSCCSFIQFAFPLLPLFFCSCFISILSFLCLSSTFFIRVSLVLSFLLLFHFIHSSFSLSILFLSPFPLSYIFFIPFFHSFPSSFSLPVLCLPPIHLSILLPLPLACILPHSLAT